MDEENVEIEQEISCKLPTMDNLPAHFVKFLQDNHIPPDAYDLPKIYRFLRINEKQLSNKILSEIAEEFQLEVEQASKNANDRKMSTEELTMASSSPSCCNPTKDIQMTINPSEKVEVDEIDWFSSVGHRFLRLEVSHRIASTPSYLNAHVYGIDLSSAAAVIALDVQLGDNVLDFCCAPGAKLAMISDTLTMKSRLAASSNNQDSSDGQGNPQDEGPLIGSVTGVDIALQRLASCKSLLKKYSLPNVRLFLDDACTFNTLAPPPIRAFSRTAPSSKDNKTIEPPVFPVDSQSSTSVPDVLTTVPPVPSKASKAMQKKGTVLQNLYFTSDWKLCNSATQLYDKVLVDAQCTLDASVRHLLRHNKVGWIDFEGNPSEVISALQKKMIFNGYRLLKPGGILVYSTCSFCTAQNEDVVRWLIKHEPSAEVQKIEWPAAFPLAIREGTLPNTVKFYPKDTGTSGMFIAKIKKCK